MPRTRDALSLGLALLAAFGAYRFVLGLELMGWDSYPMIAASRFDGPGGAFGILTEQLMGGRYPEGRFYRPLASLTFALDHAVWKLRPFGYQLTNLAILLALVAAVFALARRWLGPGVAPLVAALVVGVHPLQLETVPVAARRPDLLFTLFLVLALVLQPLGRAAPRRALLLGALCVLLSAASKDTGVIALPVVAAAQVWLPADGGARERAARALRRCALPAVALAGYLALRTAVLHGLGGHPGATRWSSLAAGLAASRDYAFMLVMPQPWSARPALDRLFAALLLAGLAAAAAQAARREPAGAAPPRPRAAGLALFLASWLLLLVAITSASGTDASWYAVPFLPAYALVVALVAREAARAWRAARGRAMAGAALAGVLVASHLRYSPLVQPYEEWTEVSREASAFLPALRAAVATAAPGETRTVSGLPLGTGSPLERVGVRAAHGMAGYSAQAWVDLALPGRRVRVVSEGAAAGAPPEPSAIRVIVVPFGTPEPRAAADAAP